jgi:hypothetical protein
MITKWRSRLTPTLAETRVSSVTCARIFLNVTPAMVSSGTYRYCPANPATFCRSRGCKCELGCQRSGNQQLRAVSKIEIG